VTRPTPFEIHRSLDSGKGRLALLGELDLASVSQLQEEISSMLAHTVEVLTIDLSQLTFIDSS
jgi:anti-anti-sigma regulatory factor